MAVLEQTKGKRFGMSPTELTVSLPRQPTLRLGQEQPGDVWYVPDSDKLNIYVHRERLLECDTLLPSYLIRSSVHVVRERNLLMVACREETNLVNHTGQRASCVGTTRETEDTDLVSSLVCVSSVTCRD